MLVNVPRMASDSFYLIRFQEKGEQIESVRLLDEPTHMCITWGFSRITKWFEQAVQNRFLKNSFESTCFVWSKFQGQLQGYLNKNHYFRFDRRRYDFDLKDFTESLRGILRGILNYNEQMRVESAICRPFRPQKLNPTLYVCGCVWWGLLKWKGDLVDHCNITDKPEFSFDIR